MIGVLFLCLIASRNSLSQTVTWTVETAVPTFGQPLKLACAVSADCCTSSFRIWEDATGTQIMNNGVSPNPDKYEEEWDGGTSGFKLIIKNLQLSDVNVDYDCRYKFGNEKKTLSQDNTWEFLPQVQCDIKVDIGSSKVTGTFETARSTSPLSGFAEYRGKNLTADFVLIRNSTFDTWFHRWSYGVNEGIECEKNGKFTLRVVTGTTTKKVCEKEDICECMNCGGICYGLSISMPGIASICMIIICICRILFLEYICCILVLENVSVQYRVFLITVLYLIISCLVSLTYAVVIGIETCPCNGNFLWLLLILGSMASGLVAIVFIHFCIFKFDLTCLTEKSSTDMMICLVVWFISGGTSLLFAASVNARWLKGFIKSIPANFGLTATLTCPFKADSGEIKWIKLNGNIRETYSEGTAISQDLPRNLRDRFKVDGKDLCISNVQESDAGIYECVLSPKPNKVPQSSKLELIVSCGEKKKAVAV